MDAHARAAHAAVVAPPNCPGLHRGAAGLVRERGRAPAAPVSFALLSALKVDQQKISEETYGV